MEERSMSRASYPSTSQQTGSQGQQGLQQGQQGQQGQQVPTDKIAMRAYEKWCRRGRSHGTDRQDWLEAEQELRNEAKRGSSSSTRR